jgi:hypothetical protein
MEYLSPCEAACFGVGVANLGPCDGGGSGEQPSTTTMSMASTTTVLPQTTTAGSPSVVIVLDSEDGTGIILDQAPGTAGWVPQSPTGTVYQGASFFLGTKSTGANSVVFQPTIPAAGMYDVAISYVSGPTRSTRVSVQVASRAGLSSFTVNQQLAPAADGFLRIGTFDFARTGPTAPTIVITAPTTGGEVVVDAVRLRQV